MGLHQELELCQYPYYSATPINVNGEPKGLVIEQQAFLQHYRNMFSSVEPELEDNPLPPLGSAEDLELISSMPLKRARYAFERAINHPVSDNETRRAANLNLAYICLVAQDYVQALDLSIHVILSTASEEEILPANNSKVESTVRIKKENAEVNKKESEKSNNGAADSALLSVLDSARMRRRATARMYAAEASCCLGDGLQAMQFLAGDGSDADAFNRLAADLGGVTTEQAAASILGKRRLARAQSEVRSSAAAVTAQMGNLTAAKQLALSAQAMEDAAYNNGGAGVAAFEPSSYNGHRSSARQALIYCLLRSGNNAAALSLLQTSPP